MAVLNFSCYTSSHSPREGNKRAKKRKERFAAVPLIQCPGFNPIGSQCGEEIII